MRSVWCEVTSVRGHDEGLHRLTVRFDDGATGEAGCYPRLTGACAPGDRVLVNTTAVDLGLGTGGLHFVVARSEGAGGHDRPSGGHVIKARYTPLQLDVLCVEEAGSGHEDVMAVVSDLGGMPVVCCGLHSQMVPVAAGVRTAAPKARIAYVMTDHAALPLALSDAVRDARRAGLIDATVSCGQAFGGEIEAVTLHSGLLAARHVAGADVAVVAGGPGLAGTATPFGHGGVAQGEALNAVACLRGLPIAVLRVSFAEGRERHRGVSHHSLTALGRVAVPGCLVAVPPLGADEAEQVARALDAAGIAGRHECRRVEVSPGELDTRGLEPRTMGRGMDEDPGFFLAAAAAGRAAGEVLSDLPHCGDGGAYTEEQR